MPRKYRQAYAKPTSRVIWLMQTHKNPVTRAVYRSILGNRIDRLEMHRLNGQAD